MSTQISVDPNGLRASAAAARGIADELNRVVSGAVASSHAAAGELAGWTIGSALENLARGWSPALARTVERLSSTATNLEATAQGHEWNDSTIAETWQRQGAR